MQIVITWSEQNKIDNTGLESYFSDFQERHITKYEIGLLGNAVKKDNENSYKFYGVVENNMISLVSLSVIHSDLPYHILQQDLQEIYPALTLLDDEIEIEFIGGDFEG